MGEQWADGAGQKPGDGGEDAGQPVERTRISGGNAAIGAWVGRV